jgi:hypothetical protein
MAKCNLNKVLWFGDKPEPPPKPWYYLKLSPTLGSFRPFGIPVKELCERTHASDAFRQECNALVLTAPPNIKQVLAHYGVVTFPVHDIFESLDFSDYGGPRGHGDRYKWPTISGLCKQEGHVLVLTEYVERDGYKYKADNRQGVFNHEMAHCFDHALGHISQQPEFLACVEADVARIRAKLSPGQQAVLHYFLADAPQGPSEIFAECLAANLNLCAVAYWTKDMCDWFPQSYEFVSRLAQLPDAKLIAISSEGRKTTP